MLKRLENVESRENTKFYVDELAKVEEVETIITGLVSMEFTYKQIQQMINDRYVKKLEKA